MRLLCSNRYYDIMPLSDLDKSVEVSSWYTGVAEEGCPISVSYGQSSSGQRWRFMLNADGSYRIGSEFSKLKKAITDSSNNSSYANYVTYEDGNNAGWELIRIYDDQDYQKDGKYAGKVSTDYQLYADLDQDDKVSIQDAQRILKLALHVEVSDDENLMRIADTDGDGVVILQDAQMALQMSLKIAHSQITDS